MAEDGACALGTNVFEPVPAPTWGLNDPIVDTRLQPWPSVCARVVSAVVAQLPTLDFFLFKTKQQELRPWMANVYGAALGAIPGAAPFADFAIASTIASTASLAGLAVAAASMVALGLVAAFGFTAAGAAAKASIGASGAICAPAAHAAAGPASRNLSAGPASRSLSAGMLPLTPPAMPPLAPPATPPLAPPCNRRPFAFGASTNAVIGSTGLLHRGGRVLQGFRRILLLKRSIVLYLMFNCVKQT